MPKKTLRSATKKTELGMKTPQSIIHIKHRITIQQYKYWILLLLELHEQMIAGIQPDEKGFYAADRAKISDRIGYSHNKQELWQDFRSLKNQDIDFNILNKDGEKARYGAGFISEWKITNSFIYFKFPSFLEDVMRSLEDSKAIFQMLNWTVFNSFSGKNEAVIYKLCKDYIGVGRTPYMDLAQFREYMGMEKNEYPLFKDFNRWVISRSVKAINESDVSDILVFPEFKKEGRSVVGLNFRAEYKKLENEIVKIPFFEPAENSPFRFAKSPISPNTQAEYLEVRTGEEIQLCIERANEYGEQQEKKGKPVKYGALYRKAISEGWHEEKSKQKEKEAASGIKKADVRQLAAEAKREEAAKRERNERALELSIQWFDGLEDDEKKAIVSEFEEESNPVDRGLFKQKGHGYIGFRLFVKKKWLNTRVQIN